MKKMFNRFYKIIFFAIVLTPIAKATEKLFIPSHPQPKAALFIALHGCLTDSKVSEQDTRLSEFGEKYGFYVLYPEPELGAESRGCFDFYSSESQEPGHGDAAVIVSKIQELEKTYDIDEQKIFVLGMSGGASLVSVLTSCYPTVFSGAAIHSGMGYGLAKNWKESLIVAQTGPLSVIQRNTACTPSDYKGKMFLIQGSRDTVMNPQHYSTLKKDYFSEMSKTSNYVTGKLNHYNYIHQRFYVNNELKGQGIYVLGMNHEWSGENPINPLGLRGPDVSKMIVEFFLNNH